MSSTPVAATSDPAPALRAPGLIATTVGLMRKDLLLEWRGRARVNATLFFSLLVLLMFSFAMGPDSKLLARTAPGFLWLTIFMSSVMSLGESMRIEQENDALEGLRLLPIDPRALFLAKTIVNTLFLFLLSMVLVPAMVAVYDVSLQLGFGKLVAILALGSAAISAPGTLQAAIASQARARDVLLPLLLFPILIPALLSGVKATDLVMNGDPMGQMGGWLTLLAGFTVMYWFLCTLLFGKVLE